MSAIEILFSLFIENNCICNAQSMQKGGKCCIGGGAASMTTNNDGNASGSN